MNCYKSQTKQLEKNTLPSLTQPDLSLTVRQIISRARQGLIDPIQKPNTFYSGTMPDLKGLDLVELQELQQRANSMEKELQKKVDKQCPDCGKDLLVRTGKFGKFLACSGFPDCKHTEPIVEQIDAKCPQDGGDVMVRKTKKGKTFYGCKNWPKCTYASWTKPVNKEVATETSPKS